MSSSHHDRTMTMMERTDNSYDIIEAHDLLLYDEQKLLESLAVKKMDHKKK